MFCIRSDTKILIQKVRKMKLRVCDDQKNIKEHLEYWVMTNLLQRHRPTLHFKYLMTDSWRTHLWRIRRKPSWSNRQSQSWAGRWSGFPSSCLSTCWCLKQNTHRFICLSRRPQMKSRESQLCCLFMYSSSTVGWMDDGWLDGQIGGRTCLIHCTIPTQRKIQTWRSRWTLFSLDYKHTYLSWGSWGRPSSWPSWRSPSLRCWSNVSSWRKTETVTTCLHTTAQSHRDTSIYESGFYLNVYDYILLAKLSPHNLNHHQTIS